MVYFGLDEYFDYVVTSEESGCDKPHVESFKLALDKLDIPAKKIWMIGDDYDSDIIGAGNVGMVKILRKHQNIGVNITSDEKPDLTFVHYKELIDIVNS